MDSPCVVSRINELLIGESTLPAKLRLDRQIALCFLSIAYNPGKELFRFSLPKLFLMFNYLLKSL